MTKTRMQGCELKILVFGMRLVSKCHHCKKIVETESCTGQIKDGRCTRGNENALAEVMDRISCQSYGPGILEQQKK